LKHAFEVPLDIEVPEAQQPVALLEQPGISSLSRSACWLPSASITKPSCKQQMSTT